MLKKAIILDLDNTIYPVPSIGDKLFAPLFQLIEEEGKHVQDMYSIRNEIMRKPFQQVAAHFHFSDDLTKRGTALLKDLKYDGKIEPFEDYQVVKKFPQDKFLVTTGFQKMQQGKVESLQLEPDFKAIHIIDPDTTTLTKKDVFAAIIKTYGYANKEVLVVGDDIHSEIKAAQELGIDAVLYDKYHRQPANNSVPKISDFSQLEVYL
jgi:putative hydrolase of the HAD superfamily